MNSLTTRHSLNRETCSSCLGSNGNHIELLGEYGRVGRSKLRAHGDDLDPNWT